MLYSILVLSGFSGPLMIVTFGKSYNRALRCVRATMLRFRLGHTRF